jgi:hypothetical protein
MYKLDRSVFKKQSFEEAANHGYTHRNLSVIDRLKISYYLNANAYNFDINNPPKMDKTVFKIQNRKADE